MCVSEDLRSGGTRVHRLERRLPRENMLPSREGGKEGGRRELLTLLATCIRDANHCKQ